MPNKNFVAQAGEAIVDAAIEDRAPESASPQFVTLTPEQFQALVPNRTDQDEVLRKQAQFQVEAHERLINPSNATHPGVSVFSYPEGDRVHPKPPLKCRIFWVGYEERVEELTPREVELYNLAEPGEYPFTRTDGTRDTVTVTGTKGPAGNLQRLEFAFPCVGDAIHSVPSKVAMLREAFGAMSDASLAEENAALRAKLAALGGAA